jgi:hypothetical protein
MTKEELTIKNGELAEKLKMAEDRDETIRKEFAIAFNWFEEKRDFGYSSSEKEFKTPTWCEIFTKIGKLLSQKDLYDLEGNVSEIEFNIGDIRNTIELLEKKEV